MHVHQRVWGRVCMYMCMCVRMCICVHVCMCACVRVSDLLIQTPSSHQWRDKQQLSLTLHRMQQRQQERLTQ